MGLINSDYGDTVMNPDHPINQQVQFAQGLTASIAKTNPKIEETHLQPDLSNLGNALEFAISTIKDLIAGDDEAAVKKMNIIHSSGLFEFYFKLGLKIQEEHLQHKNPNPLEFSRIGNSNYFRWTRILPKKGEIIKYADEGIFKLGEVDGSTTIQLEITFEDQSVYIIYDIPTIKMSPRGSFPSVYEWKRIGEVEN